MTREFPGLVADSARVLKRAFELRARELGVTREQWSALGTLARHEGINQVRFADLMDMETIGLCRMVDRLEAAGLVRRERDEADRRARRLFLTQEGWARLDRLRPMSRELTAQACAGIAPADLETARHVLGQLLANLNSGREQEHRA